MPLGSIFGPLIFNIFMNDICHFIENLKLYNYAYVNSESYQNNSLKTILEAEGERLVQ